MEETRKVLVIFFVLKVFGVSSSLRISTCGFAFGFDLGHDSLHHFDLSFRLNFFQHLELKKIGT